MSSNKSEINEDINGDVIIIGGGAAGLTAAVSAAEGGAKNTIVLEARSSTGGNGVFPIGIFAAGSRLQKHLGIEARPDDIFQSAMKYTHWKTNPRLVRALIDKSGDTINWLEDKGVEFARVIPHYPNQSPLVFHIVNPPARTGAMIMKNLLEECKEMGVEIFCQTKAEKLLTDEQGNLTGIHAIKNGKGINISAKSIIIATGGFAGNKELIKKYLPSFNTEEINQVGLPHRGDGLHMATRIGADLQGMVTLEMVGPAFKGPTTISPIASRPETIWVNKNGKRFTDETVAFLFSEGANAIYLQPGKISFTLFDEKIKLNMMDEGLSFIEELFWNSKSWPDNLDSDLRSQAKKDKIKISDSWDEIARWIGADPEVLQQTIDEYNSGCDQGSDRVMAKERAYLKPLRNPPYFAIKCGIGFVVTHGGIKINENMEVLDKHNCPIKGLYAAGVETGGADWDTYDVNLSGKSFGFSVNSGRIAGENAAKYVLA